MKLLQVNTRVFCLLFFAFPMCCIGQPAKEYQDMRLTGTLDPVYNLRYVDSVNVSYYNNRLLPGGGRITVSVPVHNNRFSAWVPPLPAGDRLVLRLRYTEMPDSAGRILDVGGVSLMTGDSIVELSIGKGTYNPRLKKFALKADVVTGEQNIARLAYLGAMRLRNNITDTLRKKLYEKTIDSMAYNTAMQKASELRDSIDRDFIIRHPSSLQSLNILGTIIGRYLNKQGGWNASGNKRLTEIDNLLQALDRSLRDSEKAQHLITSLDRAREMKLIPFTGIMPDGSVFDVASLEGKVFLIDFWGSWCGWCRKSHPHLKELYAKYKDEGFEIIGIGEEFGTGKEQWDRFRKAIAADGITWPQILNDPARQDVVSDYMVQSFPSKFLIDRNGKVVLRVLGDSEGLLDAKLKELFGK